MSEAVCKRCGARLRLVGGRLPKHTRLDWVNAAPGRMRPDWTVDPPTPKAVVCE